MRGRENWRTSLCIAFALLPTLPVQLVSSLLPCQVGYKVEQLDPSILCYILFPSSLSLCDYPLTGANLIALRGLSSGCFLLTNAKV